MAPNLSPGSFKIVSLIEGTPPTSVNVTLPAWQSVYLNGPVTTWKVFLEGPDSYRLSLGGYGYTTVLEDRVTATIYSEQDVKWVAVHHGHQDAYTIHPKDNEIVGWTVPTNGGDHAVIEIRPIIVHPTSPPTYLPFQLFRFVPTDDQE